MLSLVWARKRFCFVRREDASSFIFLSYVVVANFIPLVFFFFLVCVCIFDFWDSFEQIAADYNWFCLETAGLLHVGSEFSIRRLAPRRRLPKQFLFACHFLPFHIHSSKLSFFKKESPPVFILIHAPKVCFECQMKHLHVLVV